MSQVLDRPALRQQLLAARRDWAQSPAFALAQQQVRQSLAELLVQLEPEVLGVYWPLPGEFDITGLWPHQALPFAYQAERRMDYRLWHGEAPSLKDECGIPSSSGAKAEPDVVLVPCVGFTRAGYRLGYGGGYFDRWLAAHPGVTTVGLAWSGAEVPLVPEAHDLPLTLILTETDTLVP
jgi:5-formyltetrahydrofolate cyclo-ligase